MIVAAGRWRRLALTGVSLGLLGGCASSVPLSPPTGVDELVVPTPSPRPADFVDRVDNPWLSWTPGGTTTYVQTGSSGVTSGVAVTVEVGEDHPVVAGLVATTVTTTVPGSAASVDLFAQDRAGNVWWLGREGEWTAGQDGAEAGLWMPAEPRVGDGFRQASEDGVVEDVATITAAPAADAPAEPSPQTEVEVSSDLDPGTRTVRTYVEGTGLVRELRSGTGSYLRTADEQ